MTKYVIKQYDTFSTKGYPDELILGHFDYQPIPSNCYNLLNDDDENGDNFPDTLVGDSLLYKELVEDSVMPNN